MQIVAGQARNIILEMPDGDGIRATPVRSRKALFDSMGIFSGKVIVDLFAGSGALGLEAASRGAAMVIFVEKNRSHGLLIQKNMAKVVRAGVDCEFKLICGDAVNPDNYSGVTAAPDYVFADPPYSESGNFFRLLTENSKFKQWLGTGTLIWELPDFGDADGAFLPKTGWEFNRRMFGSREFIQGKIVN
jgi:16S rRNA (guanine966-N2)-methyltransferase